MTIVITPKHTLYPLHPYIFSLPSLYILLLPLMYFITHALYYTGTDGATTTRSKPMRVLPREKDMRQFFSEGGFSGNPEMYAFNHYRSLLGNTEWVSNNKIFFLL